MKLHAVARHAPERDAPITRPRSDTDLHELIADALRPEFDLDVIIPAVGAPIIGTAPCQVPGCVRSIDRTRQLVQSIEVGPGPSVDSHAEARRRA